jgi:hypothetical protein
VLVEDRLSFERDRECKMILSVSLCRSRHREGDTSLGFDVSIITWLEV